MALNQRERTMGVLILVMVVAFVHIWGAKQLAEHMRERRGELAQLKLEAKENQMGGNLAEAIADETAWLERVEPEDRSYENVQTELQQFLVSSSSAVGLEPFSQKLMTDEETSLPSDYYRRAKIQISVQGEQRKVVEWLTRIHQPDQFRAITYLKLLPSKIEGEVVCHVIAEQWLVPKT